MKLSARHTLGIIAGMIIGLFCGCAAYYKPQTSNPARMRSVTTVAKGAYDFDALRAWSVDGKVFSQGVWGRKFCPVDAGKHIFIALYRSRRYVLSPEAVAEVPVLAELKAGRDYELSGEFKAHEIRVFVRDVATQKKVGPISVAPVTYGGPGMGASIYVPVAQ